MFYYNRQIVYMDLWKAGERIGNAGFLKLEETDQGLRWQMRIRGLGETDTGFFDLRDETGALVDKILLQKGEGSYERTMGPEAMTRGGRGFRDICGLQVELSGGRYLKGTWRISGRAEAGPVGLKEDEPKEVRQKAAAPKEIEPERTAWKAAAFEGAMPKTPEPERTVPDTTAPKQMMPNGAAPMPDMAKAQAPEPGGTGKTTPAPKRTCCPKGRCLQAAGAQTASLAAEGEDGGMMQQTFYEDKWEQLWHMYPQIHPFGDERMFLSLTPGDFVILGREYQKLVHNSFLLHGYYNYRHVILGKYPDEEGESYYLGVPGVYYEREKMAAEMFGFEAFEGKREPAQQGDFGYYMKRVRI